VGSIANRQSVCGTLHRRRPSHTARLGSVRPRRTAPQDLRLIFIGFAWFATFIFATFGLPPPAGKHQRVIAVLAFLNSQ